MHFQKTSPTRTSDIGHWTLDFGHWTLDIGLWTLDFGHWTLNSFDNAGRAHQFAFDLVEDAVDELAAVLGGKFFGDVHRFVDADHGRNVLTMEHLVNREAEDVPVHHRHAVQFPVLGALLDLLI